MKCRNCGLRFNVTWHNFARMLKILDEIESGERKGDMRKDKLKRLGTLNVQADLLRKYVDVVYVNRRPPSKSRQR